MITALLAAFVIGAMILFNTTVTPVVFTRLDAANQAVFLRAVFPRLFIFGLVGSVAVMVSAAIETQVLAATIGLATALGFAINTWLITPAINLARDTGRKHFHLLHGISVVLFLIKLVALGVIIWLVLPR